MSKGLAEKQILLESKKKQILLESEKMSRLSYVGKKMLYRRARRRARIVEKTKLRRYLQDDPSGRLTAENQEGEVKQRTKKAK